MKVQPFIPDAERVDTAEAARKACETDHAQRRIPPMDTDSMLDSFAVSDSDFSGCSKEGDKKDKDKDKDKERAAFPTPGRGQVPSALLLPWLPSDSVQL